MITQERLKELLDYNPETGLFTWLVSKGTRREDGIAGSLHPEGYWQIGIDGKLYKAHRLAWLYMTGEWPKDQIDHINGIRDNNRFINLREATQAENHQNRALNANNVSGYPGVSWHKRDCKWQGHITLDGKQKHLGYFDTPEVAHSAYLAAKAELHTFNPTVRSIS